MESLFSIWHTFEPTLTKLVCHWAHFHCCKWRNIENNLAIWSHCSHSLGHCSPLGNGFLRSGCGDMSNLIAFFSTGWGSRCPVWLDGSIIFSIFGFYNQEICPISLKLFAKISSKFCLIQNDRSQKLPNALKFVKLAKFRQIWSHWTHDKEPFLSVLPYEGNFSIKKYFYLEIFFSSTILIKFLFISFNKIMQAYLSVKILLSKSLSN